MDFKTQYPHWHTLIQQVDQLAQDRFAPRAAEYDAQASFPEENFVDLQQAGLLTPLVDPDLGGLGLSQEPGGVLAQWMLTKTIAKADMGMSRCWEGHLNAQLLIQLLGNQEQKQRWFPGMAAGQIWGAWSGEPQSPKPGEPKKFGTMVTEVPGGYEIHGTKIFASGAPGASWAILFVSLEGPGGARHIKESPESLLMLACDLNDPTVTFDGSWWDPIGMRASVSYLVKFDGTFIPRENLIGSPGQFLLGNWQNRLTPQYASTILGGAEATLAHTLEYIRLRKSNEDRYIQHRVARMKMNVETCQLWLEKTANHWEAGQLKEAQLSGNKTRWLVGQFAEENMAHAIHICGARSLIKPSPLERISRDISFYVQHDNSDLLLSSIGKSALDIEHDASFFQQQKKTRIENVEQAHES